MSYDIDAWLEDGKPRLHIVDATSGAVRLAWTYHKRNEEVAEDSRLTWEYDVVKQLFWELFLLSSLRGINICNRTTSMPHDYQHPDALNRSGNVVSLTSHTRIRSKQGGRKPGRGVPPHS
jgi:hypothetical protein